MGWKVLQNVAQEHPGITLAGFKWRLFLQQVWESSIKEGIRISGVQLHRDGRQAGGTHQA